ncbi:MAG: AsmA family protein [Desulfobacteraceae bacterium]|jgi:uncharacterized protein involved in outer membrane biogenesis|nr:AsmA family protein [Desulfobacteraceae bacterium]
MRWIKYILYFFGGLVVLCLVLVAIVLVTFDNDDYRRLVVNSVRFFTGHSVTIEGPFALKLSAEPSLSAEAIRFDPGVDGSPPPVTTIGKLHIQIALTPLLRGVLLIRKLLTEDVVMSVTIEEKGESEDGWVSTGQVTPDIEIPIMESVHLRNIHLDVIDAAADRTVEIRLRKFNIDDIRDTGPFFVNGEGSVSGNDFKIDGRLGALSAMLRGAEPFPVSLNLTSSGFELSASGTVEDFLDGEGLKLHVSAEANELSNLFKLLQMEVPPLGRLQLEAEITQDIDAPRVSYLDVKLSGDSRVEIAANGAIANAITGEGADIQFSGSCENPDILKLLLTEDLPALNRIRMAGKLHEAQGEFTVDSLIVDALADQGLAIAADGRIGLGDNFSQPAIDALDANIKLSAPTSALLKPYVTDSLPEIGPISVQVRLTGSLTQLSLEDIAVEAGGSGPLHLSSQGRIGRLPGAADRAVSEMDLTASLQAGNTRLLASGFGVEVPELGAVSLQTRIRGSSERFELTEIDARTVQAEGLKIGLTGKIAFEQHPNSGLLGNMDLQVRLDAPTMGAAFVPLGVTDIPQLKPFQASARVKGTTEVLSLNEIALGIGQSRSLRMEVKGDIGRIPLSDDRPVSEVTLSALLQAEKTSALSKLLGVSIPDLGPLKATGRINDRKGIIGVRDVNILVGKEKSATLKATGAIASVLKDNVVAVDGMDLKVAARDLDLKSFSALLGQPLSDVGLLNGSFQLAGSPAQLAVKKGKLTTKSPRGLTMTATGGVDHIRLEGARPLKGVKVSFMAEAPDLRALPGLEDFDFPDLGSLKLTANVNDRSGNLDVEAFDLRSGSGKEAFFQMQGKILQIANPKKTALQANIETASQPWVKKYIQQPQVDNLPLAGTIRVRSTAAGVLIDEVRFGTADGKRLVLKAQGKLTNLSASPEADLQLVATVPDPAVVESMVGISLPSLKSLAIKGRLNGNAQKASYEGEFQIGETTISSKVSGAFAAGRPRIDGKFAAKIVNLEDMGIYPQAPTDRPVQTPEPESPERSRLFNDTPLSFEALKTLDLYVDLDVDKAIGRNVTIEKLDLNIEVKNGRLRIYPVNMVYTAGFTSCEFIIDASGSIPEFILQVTGEDINVDDILAYAHEPIIISGSLNLVVDLFSSGSSPREIASNLKGDIGMALENGRIRRIIDFLSVDAFDALLTTARRSRHTDLNCLINQIQFEDGVGDIVVLYMDSPRIRARGAGTVNLAAESIDMVLNPEVKRRLFRRGSPVRINGPLTGPSVRMIPGSEAALLYGDIFMPFITIPKRILGSLWYLIRNDRPDSPCVFKKR